MRVTPKEKATEETLLCRQLLRSVHIAPRKPACEVPQLVLSDVADHLCTSRAWLRAHRMVGAARSCKRGCPDIDACQARCRHMNAKLRRAILDFFAAWQTGQISKAYVNGRWQLRVRCQAKLPLGPEARPAPAGRTLTLIIDRSTLGLKVK
jgi:hypothetical protein